MSQGGGGRLEGGFRGVSMNAFTLEVGWILMEIGNCSPTAEGLMIFYYGKRTNMPGSKLPGGIHESNVPVGQPYVLAHQVIESRSPVSGCQSSTLFDSA